MVRSSPPARQSSEDSWLFAGRLLFARHDDVPGALLEYERRRLPRTPLNPAARAPPSSDHENEQQRVRDRMAAGRVMARIDLPGPPKPAGLAWAYNGRQAVEGTARRVLNVTPLREGKRLFIGPRGQRAFDLFGNTRSSRRTSARP